MNAGSARESADEGGGRDHVLFSRPLRPGHNPENLSQFDDMWWDLTPAIFEPHQAPLSINFDRFPPAWRSSVKEYFWFLLNDDQAPRPPRSGLQKVLSVRTVAAARTHLRWLIEWAIDHGYESLEHFDESTLDEVLESVIGLPVKFEMKFDRLYSIRRLWAARERLPTQLQLRVPQIWEGEDTKDLLPPAPPKRENRTPRVPAETMEPLLAWAVRFVEDFADEISQAISERAALQRASRSQRSGGRRRSSKVGRRVRLNEALTRLESNGLGVPGRVLPDGTRAVRWSYLARLTDGSASAHARFDMDLIEASGLAVDDDAYLFTRFTGQIDGEPFSPGPVRFDEVPMLWRHLTTACFIVVSYLSGMRPGEVLSLERGAVKYDSNSRIWLVTGRHWKGARDASGAKIPQGEIRADPWVVHETAARALKLLEELTDGDLVFPNVTDDVRSDKVYAARTTSRMAGDVQAFVDWVNEQCATYGRGDPIPYDSGRSLTLGSFRRTLAWHIVRRPRGLVAAGIQYGHVALKVTQGYAGDASSGFPSELAFERWLEEVDAVADASSYLDGGGAVSGPAAREFTLRVREAQKRFEGRTLPTTRQAQRLLEEQGSRIFAGRALHCVFDPEKALCARAKPDKPELDGCHSACQNIARTDADIADLQLERERLAAIESDDLAPAIRYHRINLLTVNLDKIIDTHENVRGDHGSL